MTGQVTVRATTSLDPKRKLPKGLFLQNSRPVWGQCTCDHLPRPEEEVAEAPLASEHEAGVGGNQSAAAHAEAMH